jgi:hypothetical protein
VKEKMDEEQEVKCIFLNISSSEYGKRLYEVLLLLWILSIV